MCPDITMCNGDNCPVKKKCYRYTAKPSEYQSYFLESPFKDGKCDHYWGDNQEQIWNSIKDIVNEKSN